MNDRIKLAEAMEIGITRSSDGRIISRESNPDFDPFTDANDDYAVLEWATADEGEVSIWRPFKERCNWRCWAYNVGDYARAALKVIE